MKKHPFAHLGPGPYRFVGMGEIHFSDTFGSRYIGPECEAGAGTCAHCGTGIKYIYVFKTGEGRSFGVGSDCIRKLNCPDEFENLSDFERQHKMFKRKQGQIQREKKRLEMQNECLEIVQENQFILAQKKVEIESSAQCTYRLSVLSPDQKDNRRS